MDCQEVCGDCRGCMDAMNGPFAAFRSINDTKALAAAVRTACLQVGWGARRCSKHLTPRTPPPQHTHTHMFSPCWPLWACLPLALGV